MSKKILLIEDNIAMRENTSEILQLANFEVHTASNGKEGVALAQQLLPDLIICDIMMPVLDGYGVLHMLSKQEATAGIPFIFLTAKAERTDFRKGMEMGADDYLTKPFDDIELLNAIESRFKKTAALKKEFTKNLAGLEAFIDEVKGMDSLSQLSQEKEIKIIKKKEDIYRENSYPKGIFFVNSGKIKTYRMADNGKEFITGLYKEGDFFGYLALLEETKYTDSAAAMEDSEICMLPKEDFYALIYKNAAVSKKFIKMLSDNLQQKEALLVKLAYNSVRKKVADALVTLYQRFKKETDTKFTMQVSREDLANIAGTATESTIRTLSDFKDEKLIEINGSKISILQFDKLQNMHN